MIYFLLADDKRILRDDKVLGTTVLLVAKREITGDIDKEDIAILPTDEFFYGVYDLKDIIKPKEAYIFQDEEEALFRIETGEKSYPRFQTLKPEELPPDVKIINRIELADRITKASEDKKVKEILSEEGYSLCYPKRELLKGIAVFIVLLLIGKGFTHFFEGKIQSYTLQTSEITKKEKKLDKLYEKYKNQLYILKEGKTEKGIEFINKAKKLPLSSVKSLSYSGRWILNGEVPYWKVEELKKICGKEKLFCQVKYKMGGYFDVIVSE